MILTISRDALLAGLTRISGVVGKRSTIQIISHVMIEATDGAAKLTATNLDIQASVSVAANVETAGSTTINAERLREICSRLPEGAEIAIDATDPLRAAIKAGRSKFSVGALPAKDFPLLIAPEGGAALEMAAGALARLLSAGSFNALKTTWGAPAEACFLSTVGTGLRAVSTDNKWVSVCEAAAPKGFDLPNGALIGPQALTPVLGALKAMKAEDIARLSFDPGMLVADLAGLHLIARLIGGDYFDIDRGIPKTSAHSFEIDTDTLIATVRRALIADQFVTFDLSADLMRTSARDANLGDTTDDETEIEWSGPDMRLMFNGARLLAGLEHIRTEAVVFRMNDAREPVLIAETGDSDLRVMSISLAGSR